MAGLDLDRIKKATKTALYQTSGIINDEPKAPDLKLYETLNEDDLNALRGRYGEESVMQYIKEMEAKRLGVKS